ncbi:MAG TPA: PIN domain-containing protein [Nitrososphaerales archaeon]|nr:PIN domain-containing protein [Nitrososphaerales archaeon]
MSSLPGAILMDLGGILALTFQGDEMHPNADKLMKEVERNATSVYVSDLTPYEAEAHFLSGKSDHSKMEWNALLSRLWQDPLFPRIPTTSKVYAEHLGYYRGTGGRFSYFDSYHAATSKVSGIPLVTSDGDLLSEHSISTIDLGSF